MISAFSFKKQTRKRVGKAYFLHLFAKYFENTYLDLKTISTMRIKLLVSSKD